MAERTGRYIIGFKDIPSPRQAMPELPIEERLGNFKETELGFTQGMAIEEAKRCLSCRRCLGCGLCLAVCEKKAIDFEQVARDIEFSVDRIIIAPGVERSVSRFPEKFGYGKHVNVVTSFEFESILSVAGPYGGLLIRPYDGEIPQRIGFIDCVETRNREDKSYYPSFMYAMKEAIIAKEKIGNLQVCMFFSDVGEKIESSCVKTGMASIKKGQVTAVRELAESKNLVVEFIESGKAATEEFELIVLSVRPEPPNKIRELAKKLDLKIETSEFWDAEDISLVETSKPGIFLLLGDLSFRKPPD